LQELVDRRIERLESANDREVILLRDYQEHDWEEIWVLLGQPTAAAAQVLHRRAHLKPLEHLLEHLDRSRQGIAPGETIFLRKRRFRHRAARRVQPRRPKGDRTSSRHAHIAGRGRRIGRFGTSGAEVIVSSRGRLGAPHVFFDLSVEVHPDRSFKEEHPVQ